MPCTEVQAKDRYKLRGADSENGSQTSSACLQPLSLTTPRPLLTCALRVEILVGLPYENMLCAIWILVYLSVLVWDLVFRSRLKSWIINGFQTVYLTWCENSFSQLWHFFFFSFNNLPTEVLSLTQVSITQRLAHSMAELALECPSRHAVSPASQAQVGNSTGGLDPSSWFSIRYVTSA